MNITIRPASLADAPIVNQIYGYYIDHTFANFSETNKSFEERASEMLSLFEKYPYLIAETHNGCILGFACAEPFRPQSGYRFTAETTIYLHPSAPKGVGIGSLLYKELLNELKQRGFRIAVAVLHAENASSIALHRKFGFIQTAFWKEYGFKNDQWLDAVLMEKRLS